MIANLHQPIDIIHRARGILRQRVIRPDEFTQISFLRRVQHRQVIHVRVPEEIHNSLQRADLPVDGVVVLFEQFKLEDELVVDGTSTFVLLKRFTNKFI